MVLNLLDSWCIGDEAVRAAIPQLLGLTNASDRSVKVAGDTLHKTVKALPRHLKPVSNRVLSEEPGART